MDIRESILKMIMNQMPRVRGLSKKYFFAESFMDAWFVWVPLNYMKYSGAEVGEIFNVAHRIKQRDTMSWGNEWTAKGARLEAVAMKLFEQVHKISARKAFLRAFTYYRTGQNVYGPPDTHAELTKAFNSLQSCFKQFAGLADTPIEMVQIPYTQNTKYLLQKHFDFLSHAQALF